MVKFLELDKEKILEFQKNRDPYLMIDYANKIIPGEIAEGYKDLREDDWFFKVHWKNDPNMPGMLQIESLVQMCALSILTLEGNKGKAVYLVGADTLKFYKKILPGERLNISTKILSFKRGIAKCYGEGTVNKQLACKASFTLVLTDKMIKM
jgi:3-hydroxyacyl-[acyl-carrier-protein] dehydratase